MASQKCKLESNDAELKQGAGKISATVQMPSQDTPYKVDLTCVIFMPDYLCIQSKNLNRKVHSMSSHEHSRSCVSPP